MGKEQKRNESLAHAVLILKKERATLGVMDALTLIESAMPISGTPARREAFAAAHARIADRESAREALVVEYLADR